MTDLEKALQAGAEDITEMDQAMAAGATEVADQPGRPSRYPQPRSMTASDVDLGIEDPADYGTDIIGRRRSAPPPMPPRFPGDPSGTRPADPMEADPMAQGVALAATLGPVGRVLYGTAAPVVGSVPAGVGIGAGEAYLGAKSTGDPVDLKTLAIGSVFGGIGARAGSPSAAAATRNNTQVTKDIVRGATKAPSKIANDVRFRSDKLPEVLSELPETRKALVTQSRSNPKASGKQVTETVRELTAENDAVFDAIQAQHGGVQLDGVAQRLTGLEAQLNQQGRGVAADAVARVRDDWIKRYGGTPGAKLTSEQIRNIRNDLGDVAFPGGGKKPKGARLAEGAIYDELNAAIEDVAGMTSGVDVAAFKARNRQISTLLPVQKSLGSRVSSAADREISPLKRAREGVSNAATRVGRGLRYGAEETGGDDAGLMFSPAASAAYHLLQGGRQ